MRFRVGFWLLFWLYALPLFGQDTPSSLAVRRERLVISAPVRLDSSWLTLSDVCLELSPDFAGEAAVVLDGDYRLSHCILRDVFIDGRKCQTPGVAGVLGRELSAACLDNVRVAATPGPGIVLEDVWNSELLACQTMGCGTDGESSGLLLTSSAAAAAAKPFQGTNDVTVLGGRFESSAVQARLVDATHVKLIGVKLHGIPKQDNPRPLCEVIRPGQHILFRGVSTAWGAEPLVRLEWGRLQAAVSWDVTDGQWPLDKPRRVFAEEGVRPRGSSVRVLVSVPVE